MDSGYTISEWYKFYVRVWKVVEFPVELRFLQRKENVQFLITSQKSQRVMNTEKPPAKGSVYLSYTGFLFQ